MENNSDILLANFIYVIHSFVIMFYIAAPFSNLPGLLTLHITSSISLLTHWYYNNSACFLTLMESKLRGIPSDSTFIHRIVSPIYEMPKKSLNKIIYISTVVLMLISAYKMTRHLMLSPVWTIHTFFSMKKKIEN